MPTQTGRGIEGAHALPSDGSEESVTDVVADDGRTVAGGRSSPEHVLPRPIPCCTATTTTPSGAVRCTAPGELFERMSLEAFQSGLSWLIILRKRDNFRRAFERLRRREGRGVHRPRRRASDGRRGDRPQPRQGRGHHRQRPRRQPTSTSTSTSCCGRSRHPRGPGRRTCPTCPPSAPESTAMAKELKRRGFKFVGPTTAYALMQATGMVDDHVASCWVPAQGRSTPPAGRRADALRSYRRVFAHRTPRIGNNGG